MWQNYTINVCSGQKFGLNILIMSVIFVFDLKIFLQCSCIQDSIWLAFDCYGGLFQGLIADGIFELWHFTTIDLDIEL